MKHFRSVPAAVTSLPHAPRDEERSRTRTYAITMSIRMACFLLTVIVTPYGWYTWVFAAGAIFLPYIAVVMANAAQARGARAVESPERILEAPRPAPESPAAAEPTVIRIQERPVSDDHRESA